MTIAEWGALGELVSGIAVVFSLIYVGFQIRQNTRATHAAAVHESSQQFTDLGLRIATEPRLTAMFARLNSGEGLDSLEGEDLVLAEMMLRAVFNTANSNYTQFKLGVIDIETWNQSWDWLRLVMLTKLMVIQWWRESVLPNNSYDIDFRELVTRAIEDI